MASLIESVRKLHGPHVVAHDNGYDVDVICEECTRLRLEALDQAAGHGEDLSYSAESVRVPYPCSTRTIAGTTEAEGREEASRMRLERLVVQREEIEEQAERLDAVIGLIRRDLGESTDHARDVAGDATEGDDEASDAPEPEPGDAHGDDSDENPKDAAESVQATPVKRGRKTKAKQTDGPDQAPEKIGAEDPDPGDEYDF